MGQFDDSKGFDDQLAACAVCEAMLPDAVDGHLSEAEQRAFDKHLAGCTECARELAEAQRGAAWLSLLKTQAPEPPSSLLAKILAETSGAAQTDPVVAPAPLAMQPIWQPATRPLFATPRNGWNMHIGAFRRQLSDVFSIESARATFHPRMAMTAAMAFFSIALTLNLTGVRLRDLRASNFTPSAIKRAVADVDASATRMFQNNRAVYQVESRLSELRSDDAQDAAPAGHR
jgi:anti-sigma factor RsiW